MIAPAPLTESERALVTASGLTGLELAARFGCSPSAIKRARRKIRNGESDVYVHPLPSPLAPIPTTRKHFRNGDRAKPEELRESPFGIGINPALACERHLADLREWHAPLCSLRMTVTSILRDYP